MIRLDVPRAVQKQLTLLRRLFKTWASTRVGYLIELHFPQYTLCLEMLADDSMELPNGQVTAKRSTPPEHKHLRFFQ